MVQFRFQIAAVQDGRGYCVNPEGQDQGKRWGASDVPGQVRDYTILHLDWSLFFSWAMWIYLDVYLMLLFRCEDTRVQLNTEITAREEAEAEVKWQWPKSDRFAKFHIWCQVNNCSRKVKMLEEKIEKNDERWALGKYIISTRKFDLKFCSSQNLRGHNSTHYVGNDHISSKMISKWLWILQIWEHFIKVAERFWSFCWVRRSQVLFHILVFVNKNTFCCVISF